MGCLGEDTVFSFVKGQLADEAVQHVDLHMAECPACRRLVGDCARSLLNHHTPDTVAASPRGLAVRIEPPVSLEAGQLVGRYVIERVLGWGGMGIVYAANDPSLNRKITLKFLRPDRHGHDGADPQRWLLREAQAMAQLSHPNVVSIYDVGTFEAQVFVAMEFVEGETLKRWLHGANRSLREVLDAFLAAGRGLAAAHAVGIIHRDFKPDNVLVGVDGRVRVTDFGLAHPIDGAWEALESTTKHTFGTWHLASALTETGTVRGTPAYMAPEQFSGGPTNAQTDQFSFCVALYEGIYGRRPFPDDTPEALANSVTRAGAQPPPRLATVPEALGAILVRGLSKVAEERYPSMNALLDSLAKPSLEPRRRNGRRALTAGALIAGVLIAACAALVIEYTTRVRSVALATPPAVEAVTPKPTAAPLSWPITTPTAARGHLGGPATTPEEATRAEPTSDIERPPAAAPADKRKTRPRSPVRAAVDRGYDDSPMMPSFAEKPR